MNKLISLGIELGLEGVQPEEKYMIEVNHKLIELTKLQYGVYVLAQRDNCSIESISETLQSHEFAITRAVDQLKSLGAIIDWSHNVGEDFLKSYCLTPRGFVSGKRDLKSITFASPVHVTPFEHQLWCFSNPLISIHKVLKNMENWFEYSYRQAVVEFHLCLPKLLDKGLIVLNPLREDKEGW